MENEPRPRTWGPFTGKQLTVIAVTLIVMVLAGCGSAMNTFEPVTTLFVITSIHVDVFALTSPGAGAAVLFHSSLGNATCASLGEFFVDQVNPGAIGVTVLPYEPGAIIPAGRALCGRNSGTVSANTVVTRYLIPAADAPVGL